MDSHKKFKKELQEYAASLNKMTSTGPLKEYFYKSIPDIVVREGEFFANGILDEKELAIINNIYPKIKKSIKKGFCFYNSQIAVLSDKSKELRYHEGYIGTDSFFPIHHGWNSLNGKVIDFTLGFKNNVITEKNEHIYLGIEIDTSFIFDRIVNKSTSTSYLDNMEELFPALKNKYTKPRR